jgi:hypothetical protein
MVVEAILVLFAFGASQEQPKLIGPHASLDSCRVQAEKLNRTDETLRTPAMRALGVEYACLKVVRSGY